MACWSNELEQRCQLSAAYDIFPTTQDAQNAKPENPGDLNVQNNGNITVAEKSQTPK